MTKKGLLYALLFVVFTGCDSIKELTESINIKGLNKKEAVVEEEVEISKPCYGPEYITDAEYFRASAMSEGQDIIVSQESAMTEAKSKLASTITTTFKTVAGKYATSHNSGNPETVKQSIEIISGEVINKQLSKTSVLCHKQLKTKAGKYRTYTTIELSGKEIAMEVQKKIMSNQNLLSGFQYEDFKSELLKEMINSRE